MKRKICEFCNKNEFEVTAPNRKYCDGCRKIYYKKKDIGIYKILNKLNGKVYIGQSKRLSVRINSHKRALRNNAHDNIHLQKAFNKYGEDSFEYIIIEECTDDILTDRELFWINYYNSHNREYGYNLAMPDESIEKFIMPQESRDKLREKRLIFDDDELISYLQEYYYHYGKVPVQRDLIGNGFPSYAVYVKHFGNFKNALIESDLYDFVENKKLFNREEYTKEDVYNKFKKFVEKYKRFPNSVELRDTVKCDLPTTRIVLKHYDSINDLKREFGLDDETMKIKEKEESIRMLIDLFNKDKKVTARSIDKSNITRSGKFYRNNFGTLAKACEIAGIPYALQ
ncbi:GIY-YIG nuclease family protein [Ureibacillus chungkukjangi]|uniref:homing endonuclease associated repeat-containing protein n=1 Tax=Ureibacillus chungkukjangi TaxID=1202712 RepID=UPI00203E5C92|nr:GIY-YIG nuclease family protein [Ureibacillus chungkukjangi]MCM3387334.1 GIY-YIG nuclease family protein [Ureibacillus chungkukjangi]